VLIEHEVDGMRPHGMMFHHFHSTDHRPGQGSISADALSAMIEQIGPERILPAREFLSRHTSGSLRAGDICLTFDDALRCQFDVAVPVLREFGLTAFWFVYTSVLQGQIEPLEIYRHFRMNCFESVDAFYLAFEGAVERSDHADFAAMLMEEFNPRAYLAGFPFYTDEDRKFRFLRDEVLGPARYHAVMEQLIAEKEFDVKSAARGLWMDDRCVRELHAAGHVIGLHTHTHPTRVEHLSADEQRGEYYENYAYLKNLLDARPVTMSHPCNSYNATTLEILRELGITLGFRANMASGFDGALELPREDHTNLIRAMKLAA
jgi:peptidoglycan/xylan/chitin deacetylase (PgdA/CDA1 family)